MMKIKNQRKKMVSLATSKSLALKATKLASRPRLMLVQFKIT